MIAVQFALSWKEHMELQSSFDYRQYLWAHTPITDFWRVGKGYARKLAEHDMYTMGDVARCSVGRPNDEHNEELLYKLFGINAELLIDLTSSLCTSLIFEYIL